MAPHIRRFHADATLIKTGRGRRAARRSSAGRYIARRASVACRRATGLSRARAWALVQQRRHRGVTTTSTERDPSARSTPGSLPTRCSRRQRPRASPALLRATRPRPNVSPRDGSGVAGRGPRATVPEFGSSHCRSTSIPDAPAASAPPSLDRAGRRVAFVGRLPSSPATAPRRRPDPEKPGMAIIAAGDRQFSTSMTTLSPPVRQALIGHTPAPSSGAVRLRLERLRGTAPARGSGAPRSTNCRRKSK